MAGRDLGRKGKKRTQRPVDDELVELASVLAEYQLDNNAYGWFRPPWRNGEWAVGLARSTAVAFMHEPVPDLNEVLEILDAPKRDAEVYERAGDLYRKLVQPKVDNNLARLLAAALRCLQLKIANSHGGGYSYNEVLIPAFLPIEPSVAEKHVLEFRCNDSIGTTHHLRGDHNDRQRSAFRIAWQRGLYLAAYSIPPAY